MTNDTNKTCMPRKPLRCWQYRADTEDHVPRWLIGALEHKKEGIRFSSPRDDSTCLLDDGDWIVELESNDGEPNPYLAVYKDDSFRQRFEVSAGG